jgi:hypothetical protein
VTASSLVKAFWVMHYIHTGPKIFFGIWTSWASKEFYVDFKNINLPLWQNAPKESYSSKKNFFTTQGAPYWRKSLSWNIFFRWILSLR